MFQDSRHKPVLLNEVIEAINPKPGDFIIDGTVGGGGHAASILEKIMPTGKLLALDWDQDSLATAKEKIEAKFPISPPAPTCASPKASARRGLRRAGNSQFSIIWEQGNYADLPEILRKHKLPKADGLVLDLGLSSNQLERSGRGFSFLKDEPLDMRYYTDSCRQNADSMEFPLLSASCPYVSAYGGTAAEVINSFSEKELADIFYKYGEERHSRRIAKKIIEERRKKRILTTFELVEAIEKALPRGYRIKKHPATKVFQALRIYVNDELGNLEKALKNLNKVLKIGGKAAIISFHSLEDRLVKNYFKQLEKNGAAKLLTKKPIIPSFNEIKSNPRARSAKMRCIQMK